MSAIRWLGLLLCVLLAGCFSRPRAVVVERSTEPAVSRSVRHDARGAQRDYLVVRGDTLFGIAFRHGVDFRELARWNAIASPYTIFPGQRLRLNSATPSSRTSRATSAPRITTPRTPPSTSSSAITGMPAPPGSTTPERNPPPSSAATPVTAPTPSAAAVASLGTQRVSWRWPASGQLVSRYAGGDPTRQGINIAGNGGQPVYAAAGGDVVYSGAGLIGYGELVIIKHSDEFLSAYGHNRKRLVAEGQRVTAGQQIAEMGRSGAARDMLHFEIRRNGKPVDPLPLLPKR